MNLSLNQTMEPPAKIKKKTTRTDIIHAAANELAISKGFCHGPRDCDIADAEIVSQVIMKHIVEALLKGGKEGLHNG